MFFSSLIFITACQKTDISNTKISDYIRQAYYADARQMYFEEWKDNPQHINYNKPTFDEAAIDNILRMIQGVYDSKSAHRDSIFDVYQIHKYGTSDFKTLVLEVDPNNQAISQLAEGLIKTDNNKLNGLLNTYQVDSVRKFSSYPEFNWLIMHFKKAWNPIKVCADFEKIEGITTCEGDNAFAGDGYNISLVRDEHYTDLVFSHGSGDCPSGCINRQYWIYRFSGKKMRFVRYREK